MKNICVPKNCPLFFGIDDGDLTSLLACLSGTERTYKKGETVLFAGDKPTAAGIVLSGAVHIAKEDYFGNRNIIAEIGTGGLFGEALVCAEAEAASVTVTAGGNSNILFVNYNRIITTCPSACAFHATLIRNMLRLLALKNISLVDKLEHVTKRTTQEKVLSYLSGQAQKCGSNVIEIPFNRQEMADYLSVERSALSAELSRLRDDGVIRFRKNKFELLVSE
ncbi:MAG: Crp/Fnr family transcriptional regulator [Clostridiales Family XIII bacterium]|nr:Crp/Fnr family transcriptional regulator [Clostridiales Family XIII bacterium]